MKREVSLQLMVSKRMYLQGVEHAFSNNKLLAGIAISLFQDSIELALLAAINKNDIDPGRHAGFDKYIECLEKKILKSLSSNEFVKSTILGFSSSILGYALIRQRP
jgi:hypothetical protein